MRKSFIGFIAMAALLGLGNIALAQGTLSDANLLAQEVIEAEIIRIKRAERTITVRDEQTGETRRFTIPQGTRITVQGRSAEFRDLRRGDGISLMFTAREQRPVITRVRIPKTTINLDQRRANPVITESQPAMLPKTAGIWPLFWMTGLLSLTGGLFVRRFRLSL